MTSARTKQDSRILLARQTHVAEVLLVPCPKCKSLGGEFCRTKYAGRLIVAGSPHPERVEDARPKDTTETKRHLPTMLRRA